MNYVISKEAEKDLEKIWLYSFQNWSQEQADSYVNFIFDEIEFLTKNPHFGEDYSHIKSGFYRSKVKSHFIFYKINAKKRRIEVIRILHQQMDIPSRLGD